MILLFYSCSTESTGWNLKYSAARINCESTTFTMHVCSYLTTMHCFCIMQCQQGCKMIMNGETTFLRKGQNITSQTNPCEVYSCLVRGFFSCIAMDCLLHTIASYICLILQNNCMIWLNCRLNFSMIASCNYYNYTTTACIIILARAIILFTIILHFIFAGK